MGVRVTRRAKVRLSFALGNHTFFNEHLVVGLVGGIEHCPGWDLPKLRSLDPWLTEQRR